MSELLDAVDALTLVTHRRVTQNILTTLLVTHDDGVRLSRPQERQRYTGNARTVTATEPPLLQQLDDAVSASIGGSSSGATLPGERSILRADALYQAVLIRNMVREWCRLEHLTEARGKSTSDQLRAWYAARYASGEVESGWHLETMRGWASTIRGMLNPPRELDLPFNCPICGADTWLNGDSERVSRPLIVRYRVDSFDLVENARALCRACEQVWSVRELAWKLENPDTPEDPTSETA